MKKPEKVSNLKVHEPISTCPERSADRPSYWQIAFLLLILILSLNSLLCASDQQSLKSARRASPQAGAGDGPAEVGVGQLYALVVGISQYKHPKIPQLKVSDKDARDFADFLRTQNKLFSALHITLLQNEEATRSEVEKHLYYKLRKAGKDDTVVLFLSGHGADDPNTPGEFFFLTYEAEPDYLAATSVHMSRQWFLSKLESRKVVLIADACHAGGFSKEGAKSLEPALQNFVQQFKESEGRVFLTSARPDESSMEKRGMQNSVFTNYLLQGLRGEADNDQNGVVTLEELYNYVYSKTKDETKGYQRPQMEGRIVGVFPVALHDFSVLMPELSKKYAEKIVHLTNLLDRSNEAAADELEQLYVDRKAAAWIRLAASEGTREAQFNFGRMCDKGIGVPRDRVEAVKWYRKAAEQGLSEAQNSLGLCHQEGKVLPQNYSEAVKWYQKAADQGNSDAVNNLGNAYFHGHGVSKDRAKAIEFWAKAVEKGHPTAKQNLVRYLGQDGSSNRSEEMKKYETELLRVRDDMEKLRKEQSKSDELSRIKAELEKVRKEQKESKESEDLVRIKAELERLRKEQSKLAPRENTNVQPPNRRPAPQREQARKPAESTDQGLPKKEDSSLNPHGRQGTMGRWGGGSHYGTNWRQ
jgi:TPR repeat protein